MNSIKDFSFLVNLLRRANPTTLSKAPMDIPFPPNHAPKDNAHQSG